MKCAGIIEGTLSRIKKLEHVTALEDCDLLAAIADHRDHNAFAELYRRYEKIAYCLSQHLMGSPDAASEAVQDAMLQVWLCASKFQRGVNARGWLLRIVAHSSFRVMRTRRSRQAREKRLLNWTLADNSNDVAGDLEKKEEFSAMRRALETISGIERQILALYYGAGFSQREISDELGIPQRTISMKLEKVLSQLRKHLELSGTAAAAPLLSAESIFAVLTSGHNPPADLEQATLSRLSEAHAYMGQISRVLSRKASAAGGSFGLWIASLLVIAAGAVGVWWAKQPVQPHASEGLFEKATASDESAVQVNRIHRIWNFSKGPSKDLEVLLGKWEWVPADNKTPAGMLCGNGRTLIQIPVETKAGQIWRMSLDVAFAAGRGEYVGAWGTWEGSSPKKMDECWMLASPSMRGNLKIRSITYLQTKQIVMLYYQDSDPIEEPTLIEVRVGDNHDRHLIIAGFENCRVHEVEIEEIALEEIPQSFRDAERLINERKMMPKPQGRSPILWQLQPAGDLDPKLFTPDKQSQGSKG